MSERKKRAKGQETAINMTPPNQYRTDSISQSSEPTLNNQRFDENHPSRKHSIRSLPSQNQSDGDFVKPELPVFLQNSGPGILPLRDNPAITLSWLNIEAHVPNNQGFLKKKINARLGKEIPAPKALLKGVSGIVKPGEMCAIMGASGAGKTTLLNILAHRRLGQLEVSADVRINGRTMRRDISGISAFVQQEELFIGSLTVREHLQFHAMLRLGKEFTKDERENRVTEVLHFLNLTKTENTTIGITGIVKGLSGGEKRRLTFATEILSDPPLLFCDEPTSGLDSSMAFQLVFAMRKLTDEGKTIICTIHQPSSEIFFLFDKLYLLAEGRLAYYGSLEKAPAFFRQFNMEIPRNYNPADFYIQKLAIYLKTREQNLAQIENICNVFEKSSENSQCMLEITTLHSSQTEENEKNLVSKVSNRSDSDNKQRDPDDVDVQDTKQSRYATSSFTQLRWLIWRNFTDILKNPFQIRLNITLALFIGTLIGLLYFRLDYNETAIQNINSLLFLIIMNISFSSVFTVVQGYTKEYPLFYKEYDDAVYRVTPYYFAKLITEIPTFALTNMVQLTITYWLANLYGSAKRYFIFAGIIVLTSFASVGIGSILSVVANTPQQADAMLVPIVIPLMIFGGFFLNNQSGKKWLNWIKYISMFYYANEASIINQWRDVQSLPCNGTDSGQPSSCDGNAVIISAGFDKSNFGRDIGLLIVLWITTRIISYSILFYKARKHK